MTRLQKMVSPFILRRLKEDVLKDLPEKLEEVRYVKFEDAQQKLYDAQVVHMKEKIAQQDEGEFNKKTCGSLLSLQSCDRSAVHLLFALKIIAENLPS